MKNGPVLCVAVAALLFVPFTASAVDALSDADKKHLETAFPELAKCQATAQKEKRKVDGSIDFTMFITADGGVKRALSEGTNISGPMMLCMDDALRAVKGFAKRDKKAQVAFTLISSVDKDGKPGLSIAPARAPKR